MWPRPTSGANGLTLTTTRSSRPMPCSASWLELLGDVAPGEDARRRSPGGTSGPGRRRAAGRPSGRRRTRPRSRPRRGARGCRRSRTARRPAVWRSRANPVSPSRLATESSARTCAVPPPGGSSALPRPTRGWNDPRGRAWAGTSAAEYSRPHGILGPPHRGARRAPAASETTPREPLALGVPVHGRSTRPTLSGPVQPADDRVARRRSIATVIFYNVRTRQLHRHLIYVQMYEWILWTA